MTAPPWRQAEARVLRPGLHLLECRVDDFDVRAAVVFGQSAALVWDTLAHPVSMGPAVRLLGNRSPIVVYSHGDWDHVWGTGAFAPAPQVVAHAACAERFQEEIPAELAGRMRAEPGRWEAVRLVPPTRSFSGALELDLGRLSVRLEALPGHTPDCLVAWIPAWGVLLAGDTVETPLPFVNDGDAVGMWIEGLRRWTREPALTCVVPAHGDVGGVEVVNETLHYLKALLAGAPLPVPDGAPAFYRRTHEDNVRRVTRAAHGGPGPAPGA
jgi:glyoxylase-like metal-dependent hydrolase (beta-lactamase superfamily II)